MILFLGQIIIRFNAFKFICKNAKPSIKGNIRMYLQQEITSYVLIFHLVTSLPNHLITYLCVSN